MKKIGKVKPEHVCGIFTIQRVNLEACHLLRQNRLGQVGQNRVVDGEVAVIMIQQPDSCPLDTTPKSQEQNKHVTQLLCYGYHHLKPFTIRLINCDGAKFGFLIYNLIRY